jgi:hypothetical protein
MTEDVKWYLRTCDQCQQQQMKHVVIPPTPQRPQPLFYRVYCDTMFMPVSKGRHHGMRYILQARDSLTHWPEYMIVRKETAAVIEDFLYKNVLCRWGTIAEIVTDNGTPWVKAVADLAEKYQLKHIRISSYNSRANGTVEQSHRSVREAIVKVSAGDIVKWPEVVASVFWAERIAIHSATGLSPFYMVHGIHPTLPMDIVEATWLVSAPMTLMNRQEMIAYRATQLLRRPEQLADMESRITASRYRNAERFREEFANIIKDYRFNPGDLVLIRNSHHDGPLRDKTQPRYIGPYIVAERRSGGAYIVADLDGTVIRYTVAQFRVIPYLARKSMTNAVEAVLQKLEHAEYAVRDADSREAEQTKGRMDRVDDDEAEAEQQELAADVADAEEIGLESGALTAET